VSDRRTQRGFTLVEVGFSIAIIALLIGLLLIGLNSMNKAARRAVERQNVASLKMGVDHFQDTFGFLPPLVDDGRISGSPPLVSAGGSGRMRPVIYSAENDWDFLRGDDTSRPEYERFSVHSIAYYLLGALGSEVDGIDGPGFGEPLPDGRFRIAWDDKKGEWYAAGRRTDPLFDTSKNPEGLYYDHDRLQEGRVELRDRNGVAYRYYRWISGDENGEIKDASDLNIPDLLGKAEDNPELRSAKFAIVAAGPNRVFGEGATEGGAAGLALALGQSASDPVEKLESLGRQDNIVEVGR